MSFTTEGDIPVQITQVVIADSTLNKKYGSADICIEVKNEDGTQSDWWRGNISADLTRVSNRPGQTNTQVTFDNLVSLGYAGVDFSRWPNDPNVDWNAVQAALDALVGVVTTAHCARSTCGRYINVKWLGGGSGNTPSRIDLNQLSLMAKPAQAQQVAGFGGQPAQGGFGQQQPAQPATGGFGKSGQPPQQGGFSGGFGR